MAYVNGSSMVKEEPRGERAPSPGGRLSRRTMALQGSQECPPPSQGGDRRFESVQGYGSGCPPVGARSRPGLASEIRSQIRGVRIKRLPDQSRSGTSSVGDKPGPSGMLTSARGSACLPQLPPSANG